MESPTIGTGRGKSMVFVGNLNYSAQIQQRIACYDEIETKNWGDAAMGRTYTEEEIQDLTDRVFLLKEQLAAGKVHIAAHLADGFQSSLEAIRLRPDGKVDPSTIDGRIRSLTLAMVAMRQREEAKKAVSLAQIQEAYFDFLFFQFGVLYEPMIKAGANPAQAGRAAARDVDFVKQMIQALPDFLAHLKEFWMSVGDSAAYHLQDGRQLKTTFAGDLFPAHWENAVSTAGLYVDTIVLPCPVMRIAPLVKVLPAEDVVSLLVKHVLSAMSYRALAIADVDPPLALVVPDPRDVEPEKQKSLVEDSEPLICMHANYLFGRTFESLAHLTEFCGELATVDQVMAELKGRDRLIFSTEWRDRDPRSQLQQTMKGPALPGLAQEVAGNHILKACLGRMPQAMAAQKNARHFGATPLINAETSWLHYTWMLEYEGTPVPNDSHQRKSMHVVRALVSEAGNNLEWLGNVPPETVLEIRKRGLAQEVRSILGQGVSELVGINPDNYFRTADQVVENLDRAFREHQKALSEAKLKKLKLYGIDVAACIAVGGVGVAAALTSNSTLGAVSSILGVAGFANLKDIATKFSQIVEEDRARKASPTGLLFQHVKR